ncbi:MAG: TauD/TfdA family dioxygenase [Proteobacteria bacterium]|nr:TauD/TfdA family dioxygenase [Pseudomonadota bacterium]
MASNHLDIQPISGAMGAEVSGVDLAQPLDDQTFGEIYQALLDHCAIFFRDQDITPAQQVAFARRFGDIHLHPHIRGLPDQPEVFPIIKDVDDVSNLGDSWHTDQMFTDTPVRVTMLYAKEVPPFGGDTLFANAALAYDNLSDGMKAMLAGLSTRNQYNKKKPRAAAMKVEAVEEEAPQAVHPLIRVHRETGRNVIYISYDGITRNIVGMTEEESRPLLDYLRHHVARPEHTCRFRWQAGTLGLWDNRSVQHLAINDYHGYRRVMHRITAGPEASH